MSQISWIGLSLNLKTGKINNCTLFTFFSKVSLFRPNIIYVVIAAQEDEAILFLCMATRKRTKGVSLKAGMCHSVYDMTVHYKKANAVASTNIRLFIKWVPTHKTVLNYLVEIRIFHHRNKGKQRRGDKIGNILWNSSRKPCFSKGNTESLTNAMAHESLSTCQTNHSSKNPSPNWDCEYICIFSTLRED